jgi:hypothetical protein
MHLDAHVWQPLKSSWHSCLLDCPVSNPALVERHAKLDTAQGRGLIQLDWTRACLSISNEVRESQTWEDDENDPHSATSRWIDDARLSFLALSILGPEIAVLLSISGSTERFCPPKVSSNLVRYQRQPENLDLLAFLFDRLPDGLNFTASGGDYLPVSSEKLDSANQKAVVLDHLDLRF